MPYAFSPVAKYARDPLSNFHIRKPASGNGLSGILGGLMPGGIPIPSISSGPAVSSARSNAEGKIVFNGMNFDSLALPWLVGAGVLVWWLVKQK